MLTKRSMPISNNRVNKIKSRIKKNMNVIVKHIQTINRKIDMKNIGMMALFITLSISLYGCSPKKFTDATAITNVTVIDSINGIREKHTVFFEKDQITAIEMTGDEPLNVSQTIDGTDKYLIPGLWDMHVHLTYDDAFTEDMPNLFLAYGITSVRDTGGLIEKLEPVIKKMRAENAISPRVYFSGPLLDGEFVVYDGGLVPEIGTQNSSTDIAQKKVADLYNAGVDFIKIYEMVSPEVFTGLSEAASRYELPIAAHVPLSMTASMAGPIVDSMEHLRNVELDCAANSAELHEERLSILNAHKEGAGLRLRGSLHTLQRLPAIKNYDEKRCNQTLDNLKETIQVPTLRLNAFSMYPGYERNDWQTVLEQVPFGAKEKWIVATEDWFEQKKDQDWYGSEFAVWSMELVDRMNRRGVPIGAGTDTPIGYALPGYSLHTELEFLVEAGLTPLEALHAATVRPTEFFSLEESMGTLDVGKVADMVLLNANPLENISNTRQINLVISKGMVLKPEILLSSK